jgi:hypothetical protein
MTFTELPEQLQNIIRHISPDAIQARLFNGMTPFDTWRLLTIDHEAFPPNAGQLLVPVRTQLRNASDTSRQEWDLNDVILPVTMNCRTEYLTLTRLYDGHFPSRYFVGQSQETGTFYWAEQDSD